MIHKMDILDELLIEHKFELATKLIIEKKIEYSNEIFILFDKAIETKNIDKLNFLDEHYKELKTHYQHIFECSLYKGDLIIAKWCLNKGANITSLSKGIFRCMFLMNMTHYTIFGTNNENIINTAKWLYSVYIKENKECNENEFKTLKKELEIEKEYFVNGYALMCFNEYNNNVIFDFNLIRLIESYLFY